MSVRPWLCDPGQSAFYRQIAQADQFDTDELQDRYGEISVAGAGHLVQEDAPARQLTGLSALVGGRAVTLPTPSSERIP